MQDIDFDEIDRAVSSVTNPKTSSVKVSATPRVDSAPTETATEPVVMERSAAPSPAVRRSSGRFMDVVHSSSDMRPAPTRPQALTVADVIPAPAKAAESEEPTTSPSEAFHWPDPIDMNIDDAPKDSPEAAAPPVETPAEPESEEVSGPLESPFISNAKVEKRPLGAFSDSEPELLTPEDFPSSQTQTPEPTPEPEVPENHEEPAEVPAELNEDVLNLEAQNDELKENHDAPQPEVAEAPAGPTSITQQYKEQPSSAGDASGAIFDTEVYNQALVHKPQSTKKALIVVWIAAVILVGGGIGAAVYFVLKPTLG